MSIVTELSNKPFRSVMIFLQSGPMREINLDSPQNRKQLRAIIGLSTTHLSLGTQNGWMLKSSISTLYS